MSQDEINRSIDFFSFFFIKGNEYTCQRGTLSKMFYCWAITDDKKKKKRARNTVINDSLYNFNQLTILLLEFVPSIKLISRKEQNFYWIKSTSQATWITYEIISIFSNPERADPNKWKGTIYGRSKGGFKLRFF